MIDWSSVKVLTFECFGPLVDWETGILQSVKRGLTTRTGKSPDFLHDDDQILRFFAQGEPAAQAGPYKPYREVLKVTALRIGDAGHLKVPSPDVFAQDIGGWPLFPDTADALRGLKGRFKLALLTNADRDVLSLILPGLGVAFDEIITSDQVQAYKPALKVFQEAVQRLGGDVASIVHVASSLYHDIEPATGLGIQTVRVDRRGGRPGGASQRANQPVTPTMTVASLAELLEAVG